MYVIRKIETKLLERGIRRAIADYARQAGVDLMYVNVKISSLNGTGTLEYRVKDNEQKVKAFQELVNSDSTLKQLRKGTKEK